MNCTLCNTPLSIKTDEYYFSCLNCGAILKDKQFYISAEEEKKRYLLHLNDVNDLGYQKFTSPITNFILLHCKPSHLGLDYGSGTGPVITKCLQDKNFQVKLYDPYFYPDKDYLNYTYDYIFSCEVFEHFYKPKQEIEKLLNLLKNNAYFLIMTHIFNRKTSFEDWYYRKDPTHVFIYTKETIEYIARQYALKIIEQTERLVVFQKSR